MGYQDKGKQMNDIALTIACNNFAMALKAVEYRNDKKEVLSHKGKTLFSVNRELQATAKITVGYSR